VVLGVGRGLAQTSQTSIRILHVVMRLASDTKAVLLLLLIYTAPCQPQTNPDDVVTTRVPRKTCRFLNTPGFWHGTCVSGSAQGHGNLMEPDRKQKAVEQDDMICYDIDIKEDVM
jgi:hypothetical protein